MKVLITGSSGFMGTHLCQTLEARGDQVTALSTKNADLLISDSLASYSGVNYDIIYHLAAWTQAGDFCLHHPGEQWIINQRINTNVLAWWQAAQPQAKLIAMGTSCSYAPDHTLIEENYMAGLPIKSLYPYAMTKRMLLVGLEALHAQYGLRYLYVVPSTLYGPHYHLHDGKQMHFIFDLIRKIVAGRFQNRPVVLWGNGHQKRELIHVGDFISALLGLSKQVDNEVVNVGGGEEHTIREFAEIICRLIGYSPAKISYDISQHVGATSKILSIAKLQRLLPNFRQRSLEEGLYETMTWYLNALALWPSTDEHV